MKNVTRHLVLAGLSACICLFSFCTINDDNGSLVDPGNTNTNTGDPSDPLFVPILEIFPDSNYVSVGDTIRIRVKLSSETDEPNRTDPVTRAHIGVETNFGTLSDTLILTDRDGEAAVRLTGETERTATVVFTYNYGDGKRLQQRTSIAMTDNPTRNFTLNASPSVLPADGLSTSTITVQVKNEFNNPIIGDSIQFSSTAGMITAVSVTDNDGRATARLTSDRRNTNATIKAWLKNDPNGDFFQTMSIEFTGVTITAVPSPTSIRADGSDTSTILITLIDAAGNPIVGERAAFSKQLDSTIFVSRDETTNSRGEARVRVIKRPNRSGDSRFIDTITVTAAGASAYAVLTYSNYAVNVTPRANQRFIADPTQQTTFDIDGGSAMNGATFEVSVTLGTNVTPGTTVSTSGDVVFADSLIAGTNGRASFSMQNPSFTSIATIFVRAIPSGADSLQFTTASYTQYFQASAVDTILISGTSSVININGATAKITAVALDERGNRVKGAIISFNLQSGSGGGEYLEPATATTAADGTASTYLISGTIPSSYNGVSVRASDFAGKQSQLVRFTIAGPPHSISIDRNIGELVKYPAAYGKKVAVLVSDVNGNPVADGTEVTFSAQVTGYVLYRLRATFYWATDDTTAAGGKRAVRIDTVGVLIASEHLNKSRPYSPVPCFEDINWSGLPNRGVNWVEPCDPLALEFIGGQWVCNGLFADFNGNGVWDNIELKCDGTPFEDHEYNLEYNDINAPFDINWRANVSWWNSNIFKPNAEPQSTVLITRTAVTANGIAENELVYGQSAAWRYEVKLVAESQGLVTSNPEQFVLPIEESDRKYWTYRY